MKKMKPGRNSVRLRVTALIMAVVLAACGLIVLNYPRKMKKMFISTNVEAMSQRLDTAAEFTDKTVSSSYTEIGLMADMINPYLDGTDQYSAEVFSIMRSFKEDVGYTYVGIHQMASQRMFATLSDGSQVQLDSWALTMDMEDTTSVEFQTSPFRTAESGHDAVVYRHRFVGADGQEYMLVAEKPQETLDGILNIESGREGLVLMVRDNGNVVYSNGNLGGEEFSSYNVVAYFSQLGAGDAEIQEVTHCLEEEISGLFTFQVGGEPCYFIFHRIENTNWICMRGYRESILVGEELQEVNRRTIELVGIVAGLLLMSVILMGIVTIHNMKEENNRSKMERETLFEEMSRHIRNAFVILQDGVEEPSFISHNFEEIIPGQRPKFTMTGLCEWCGIEITEAGKAEFLEKKWTQAAVERDGRNYDVGFFEIGIVNGKEYSVVVFNDVTADIQARKLLEDSIARADEASKSKTSFLSKMSHEIRTPLNTVLGFSALALQREKEISREELLDYIGKIHRSGNYLLDLVSDILDISRIEEGRMQLNPAPCRLDDLVEEVASSFYGQMKTKKLDFKVVKGYDDISLNMDSYHLKQVLNNLISNSCKYTEEGGTVSFCTYAKPMDERRASVRFIVEDNGIGMTPEFLQRIFEPFTQEERGMKMKSQLRGSGLGMSICKNLVELQNGTIKVDSELGEGTEFVVQFTFDIVKGASGDAVAAGSAETDYGSLRGKKILVVDDVEMNRIIVDQVLKTYGLQSQDADCGQAALDALEASQPGEFFAVFMDIRMPGMNGYETTERVRKLTRSDLANIPIVAMTADAFSDDVSRAMLSGMNYHVTKPIQIERVMNVLMSIYRSKEQ